MNYRIGLDIGIASVGWAVLENGDNDEPFKIVDLGVRCFDTAEIPKTGGSLAAPRRNARTARRRLRRRRHRLERIRQLLVKFDVIKDEQQFMQRYYQSGLPDVYRLRYEGLDRRLNQDELAQVLIHIAKHRGFKSTRKAELKDAKENKEVGKVLSAIGKNQSIMKEQGYRTVGEMIYLDDHFKMSAAWNDERKILAPRNKADSYKHTILRDMLEEEINILFECQRDLGNMWASKELEEAYLVIFKNQRSFDMGPGKPSPYAGDLIEGMVGKCTFERQEKRAPKASYTAERFVLLQKINQIRIKDINTDEVRGLTDDERQAVIELAYGQKEIKYSAVRNKIKLSEKQRFKELDYGSQTEKTVENAVLFSMKFFYEVKKILGINEKELTQEWKDKLDDTGNILTLYKTDDNRREQLKRLDYMDEEIENLLELNPSKFQHLSFTAMKKIIPYLEQGFQYYEACEKAGYSFNLSEKKEKYQLISGELLQEVLDEIPNPVVKRSISQTIKVLNAIIRKYGSPQCVYVELAREMAKDYMERKRLQDEMDKNRKLNERIKQSIIDSGVLNPTGQDIVKLKLWKEQDGRCLYSGNVIPYERLFEKGYAEIDHIIPYSRSFDDSYKNKVLVLASENKQKGNRIPYEYFGHNESKWEKFEKLVVTQIKNYRKRDLLLKKKASEEEEKAFKERNLTDTKYITRMVYNLLNQYLLFTPYTLPEKKKKVFAVNGSMTAYLRKRWGIDKIRSAGDKHHAADAVVIACCTDKMIQRVSRYVKGRELEYTKDFEFTDEDTGEIFTRKNFSREQWDIRFGVRVPLPWKWFRDELDMRMSDNPMDYRAIMEKHGYYFEDGQEIKAIFVSRMPNHKVTGACHADTIRSPRHFEDEGIVLSKTSLSALRLDKEGEIVGYYNPDSDRLLYEALKERLVQYEGKGEKAFEEPFYKPRADGTPGPLVKKVKLKNTLSIGASVNGGNGIAGSTPGSMVRIDVFKEGKKYYYVPVYRTDTVKKELPNKAVVAHKRQKDWKVMKEEDFLFSLYPNDIIQFVHPKGMPAVVTNTKEKIKFNEEKTYFRGADISVGSFSGYSHDKSFEYRGCGIQTLKELKKFQVDVLGNVSEVKREKRMKFK